MPFIQSIARRILVAFAFSAILLGVSCKNDNNEPAPETPESHSLKDSIILIMRTNIDPNSGTYGTALSMSLVTGETRTITKYRGPGIGHTKDGNDLFIVSGSSGTPGYAMIEKIDIAAKAVVKTGTFEDRRTLELRNMVAHRNKLYLLYTNPNYINVINAETLVSEDTINLGKDFFASDLLVVNDKLFVSCPTIVTSIDLATPTQRTSVSPPSKSQASFMFINKENQILVAGAQAVLDPNTYSFIKLFGPFNFDPVSPLAFDKDTNSIFFAEQLPFPSVYPYSISKFDYNTGKAATLVDGYSGAVPQSLSFIRYDHRNNLLVVGAGGGVIHTYDETGKLIGDYKVNGNPIDAMLP